MWIRSRTPYKKRITKYTHAMNFKVITTKKKHTPLPLEADVFIDSKLSSSSLEES